MCDRNDDSDDNSEGDHADTLEAHHDDDDDIFEAHHDEAAAKPLPRRAERADVAAAFAQLQPPSAVCAPLKVLLLDVMFMDGETVLFGREARGGSVALFVQGWYPYLCVEMPPSIASPSLAEDDAAAERLKYLLNEKVEAQVIVDRMEAAAANGLDPPVAFKRKKNAEPQVCVQSVVKIVSKNILGYDPSPPKPFWKICVREPRFLRPLRKCLERLRVLPDGLLSEDARGTKTFNSNLDASLQMMVDVGMQGCQWCLLSTLPAHDGDQRIRTACQMEVHGLHVEDLVWDNDDESLGPLRLLSFDIEAAGRRGVFPQASIDPVIQISLHFKVLGLPDTAQPKPILLSYKQCDPIDGAYVLSYDNEDDMLIAFRDLVLTFDADVFTGWNVALFDFLYLRDRAIALGCDSEFEEMTKLATGTFKSRMYLKETVYQSVAMGKRRRVKVSIPGRVCLDLLIAVQNNYKLESYTLKHVSANFLGDTKVDLPFTQITPLWERDSAGRKELGIYCLKDAQLPLDLMEKLDSLTQTVEMARAVGIPLDFILSRGIMIRTASLLLRRAKVRGYLFPYIPPKPEDLDGARCSYHGATVLEAVVGIHTNVGVLVRLRNLECPMKFYNSPFSKTGLFEHVPVYHPCA